MTTTAEFGGPGPLPFRGGVIAFSRRSPVAWGGEYAPPGTGVFNLTVGPGEAASPW